MPAILPVNPSEAPKSGLVHVTAKLETKEIDARDYAPITDPKNVKRFVSDYFTDIPIMAHIASCESHNRQYNAEGEILRGKQNNQDVGVMQINEKYHLESSKKLGYDIYTIEGNVAYARYIYEKQGAKPWMSSSYCWAEYAQKELARK